MSRISTDAYLEALDEARAAGTLGIEGTRPYDSGWGIRGWIEQTIDGRTFRATIDVQSAYEALGLEGIALRAQVALDAFGSDARTCDLAQVWADLLAAASEKIEEAGR